jgi:hypothetical protein
MITIGLFEIVPLNTDLGRRGVMAHIWLEELTIFIINRRRSSDG